MLQNKMGYLGTLLQGTMTEAGFIATLCQLFLKVSREGGQWREREGGREGGREEGR